MTPMLQKKANSTAPPMKSNSVPRLKPLSEPCSAAAASSAAVLSTSVLASESTARPGAEPSYNPSPGSPGWYPVAATVALLRAADLYAGPMNTAQTNIGDLDQPSEVDTVSANGIEIAYESFGKPTDVPVLLIMGLATQMLAWPEEF